MKKLIIALFSLVMLTSCVAESEQQKKEKIREAYQEKSELVELSFNGETHEFVIFRYSEYRNGIAHWPGCKYCKH